MKNWQRQEKKDAEALEGRQTPRSGGLWFAKGDSKSETFLIDSKTSEHKRFSVTERIWNKINKEALLSGRLPMLILSFAGLELVVMDKGDFINLFKKNGLNES